MRSGHQLGEEEEITSWFMRAASPARTSPPPGGDTMARLLASCSLDQNRQNNNRSQREEALDWFLSGGPKEFSQVVQDSKHGFMGSLRPARQMIHKLLIALEQFSTLTEAMARRLPVA